MGLALAALLGCSLVHAAGPQVNIYNWYDFIAPDTMKNFQAETGIGSMYDVFDNSDVMQSKLMAGRSGYDVVVATGDLLPNLIKAGVLKELDPGQLPNRVHLDPAILAKMQSNDPRQSLCRAVFVGHYRGGL
jgi:putrescine transport system substrate-binding protein